MFWPRSWERPGIWGRDGVDMDSLWVSQATVHPRGQEEVQQGGALLGSGWEQPDDKRAGFLQRPRRPPSAAGPQARVGLALKFNNIILLPLNCFLLVPLIYH